MQRRDPCLGACDIGQAMEVEVDLVSEWDGPGRLFRLRSAGCLYFTADRDAGLRAYRDAKGGRDDLWPGYTSGCIAEQHAGLRTYERTNERRRRERDSHPRESPFDALAVFKTAPIDRSGIPPS